LSVDFDPEEGIPAGHNWERELYAQLRRTDAVIFLASEDSVASQWCFSEVSLARRGGPLAPRIGIAVHPPDLDDSAEYPQASGATLAADGDLVILRESGDTPPLRAPNPVDGAGRGRPRLRRTSAMSSP
jgi:hypothetical protein